MESNLAGMMILFSKLIIPECLFFEEVSVLTVLTEFSQKIYLHFVHWS